MAIAIGLVVLFGIAACVGAYHNKAVPTIAGFAGVALMTVLFTSPAHAGDYDISAEGKTRSETLSEGRVQQGVVLSVREIRVESTTTAQTVSTGIGGLIGGALGSKVGKGNGRLVAGALGAVLGGVSGNMAGDAISSAKAQEVIIKKDDGQLTMITQSDSNLTKGQTVYLVESMGKTRVIVQ